MGSQRLPFLIKTQEVTMDEIKVEEIKKTPKKVTLTPEQIASRKLAHDIKVAKFLGGGEF